MRAPLLSLILLLLPTPRARAADAPPTKEQPEPSGALTLWGQAVDRAGGGVACTGAVLLDHDLVVACDAQGRFAFTLPAHLDREALFTVLVYAEGRRDRTVRGRPGEELRAVMRPGRSRRSQSTTLSGVSWREAERGAPTLPTGTDIGAHTLTLGDQRRSAGGYQDVNRSLHALPGVAGDTAASARLRVRAGEPGETLLFIDGIRVEDATHLGGLFGGLDPSVLVGVDVETGVPPASSPEALAGSVSARYLDAPDDRLDGTLDLSFLGGGAMVAVDLARKEQRGKGAALVVAARRSFLQAYLGAFKAAGLVDIPLEVVDFGSAFSRLTLRRPKLQARFSLLHLHDRAVLDDLNLRHRLFGGSAELIGRPGPRTRIEGLLTLSWEESAEPEIDYAYPGQRENSDARTRARLRVLAVQGFGVAHRLTVGAEAGGVFARLHGRFDAANALPPFAAAPLADLLGGSVEVERLRADHGELDLFAEVELAQVGPFDVRAGLRASVLNASTRPRLAPRLAVSLPLLTGMALRAGIGLTHQDRTEPLLRRLPGGSLLRPERALLSMLSVGQDFGAFGVVQVMGWVRAMDQLVVWADVPDGLPTVTNDGRGIAGGVDVSYAVRLGRFEGSVGWSFQGTTRRNPRSVAWPERVPGGGDSRHDGKVDARLYLGRKDQLVLGLGWATLSGPPRSTLSPVADGDRFAWVLEGLNDRRLPAVHRVDLRIEHRMPSRHVLVRGSFELNADLGGKVFLEDCPGVATDEGEPPRCAPLTFWPALRPWFGLALDF